MKPRRLIWASSALCLLIASCEKSKSTSAATGDKEKSDSLAAERAALEDERMALERQRLEDERAALEEEKAALEAEREARLAQREDDADQRDLTLEERQRALADREIDLSEREGDLAVREAGLSDRELELAGRESLDDWEPEPVEYYEEPVADYGTFYDDLQPYGSWFETPDYGYVYQPTIVVQDNSWRPYTRGRWACTNRGWAWVSDEPFGWACFHYGRWTLINGRGWVWVPGDEWAPSWVTWREGGDCIGWAPLPPETMCYRGRGWSSSVEGDFGIGHGCFTFVRCRNMADPIWRHCLPIGQNGIFIKQTVNITNIHIDRDRVVCGGPRFDKLRGLVGRPWPVYQLETDRFQGLRDLAHRNSQLRGNRLTVFAPSMNTRWNAELKPQRVSAKWEEVKVVRAEGGIKPEWTERFRETRQKQKEQAVTWKRDHSAGEDMQKQLQANREKVAEAQKTYQAKQREIVQARREKVMEKKREQQQVSKVKTLPGMTAAQPAAPDKTGPREAAAGKPTLAERQRELAERMRESRNRGQGEARPEAPQTAPDRAMRPPNPPAAGIADNRRERQQPQTQEQTVPGRGNRERNDGGVAQDDSRRQQLEEARRQQQEQVRQRQEENRQRQEEARQTQERSRNEAEENTRRQRMEDARREQQEAAREKAEQARQQQDERQRQMEENRQRRQEEARERQEQSRRQAEENQRRQQQEEMQRQQQERARQQQEERARQQQEERARQQEQERARQEERMREQQERARQQEEQRARQQEEMQRRQEEARRQQEERARQQQEERARQQEQARQQQEERQRQQEESRRQQEESRRQQEERSRQEQDERSRRQQEESQRQRGGR